MSAPIMSLSTNAARAGKYPKRSNKREAKLLESVKDYVDNISLATANLADASVTTAKLGPDAVTNAKLADASVSIEQLDSGIAPSHIIKAAGTHTTAGGDTSETITATGATATDIVVVTVQTAGAVPVSIVAAAAGTDTIAVTTSADPSTDHVLQWVVIRAAS